MSATPSPPPPTARERVARALPWLVSFVMCGVLLWPFHDPSGRAALVEAMRRASSWTIPAIVFFAIATWVTDSWTIAMTFRHFGTNVGHRDMLLVRGVAELFDAVNPVLGQIAIGIAMVRRGTPLARTVQTLLLLGVVFSLELIGIAGVGLALGSYPTAGLTFRIVFVSLALTAAYLVLIAVKPSALARTKSLGDLFQAGLRGHAVAFAVRLPSMVALLGRMYVLMRCFGVDAPLSESLVYLVAVLLVTGLPISVQGIGPAQLAQVAFFAKYVAGDERTAQAAVVAWGLTASVGTALGSIAIGVGCLFTKVGRSAFTAGQKARGKDLETAVADDVDG